jgi:hypothetical protein
MALCCGGAGSEGLVRVCVLVPVPAAPQSLRPGSSWCLGRKLCHFAQQRRWELLLSWEPEQRPRPRGLHCPSPRHPLEHLRSSSSARGCWHQGTCTPLGRCEGSRCSTRANEINEFDRILVRTSMSEHQHPSVRITIWR